MSAIDVEKLLSPVSEQEPCGPDLSYDPAVMELDQIAQGKPEQQVGETVIPAEPPDWEQLEERSLECLGRTKDLRVAMHLAMALVRRRGFAGLTDGLAVIRGLLEKYWDKVHPQLDPEDGNDPLVRMNIVSALTDPVGFRRAIREAPLAASKMLGRFGLREIEIVAGEAPAPTNPDPNAPPLDATTLEGAFADTPIEDLKATSAAAAASIEHVKAIDALLTQIVGAGKAINFKELESLIARCRLEVDRRVAAREGTALPGEGGPAEPSSGGPEGAAASVGGPISGQIRSKQDVIRIIDRICDYYAQNEPSSPVPLLLKRAQRLVSKDFLEIMKDLSPEGLRAIETLAGINPPPEQ